METQAHEVHPKDRIYKTITLRTSRGRVWSAISDAKQFGLWFGAWFDGPFVEGEKVTGTLTPTMVDPEVANEQRLHAGMPIELYIDRIEPDRLIRFGWQNYDFEAATLVTFEIEDDPEGVVLTITESGFSRLPPARRAKAFAANERGWDLQMLLIQKYLSRS